MRSDKRKQRFYVQNLLVTLIYNFIAFHKNSLIKIYINNFTYL
jgi:hypothetical protein